MYDSMRKYFSAFILDTRWISTPNILHPSSAGMGRILNIASHSDIMAAKARSAFRPALLRISSAILTAPTGPDKAPTHSCTFLLSKENSLDQRFPSHWKVSENCALISCHPNNNACANGTLYVSISSGHPLCILIPKKQLSSGQVPVSCSFLLFLAMPSLIS